MNGKMQKREPYKAMSADGLSRARAKAGQLLPDAVDGGEIVLVDPLDQARANVIGAFWLVVDPADPGIGYLHSAVDHNNEEAQAYAARATEVESYMSSMLIGSRRLDVVHLVRQGRVVDYAARGREHDKKLAAVIASIQARNRG